MRREDHADGPRWRAILEARWQDRVQEVTELSVAYHGAADAAGAAGGSDGTRARRLLRRAVTARRRLADTEDALGRLAAGDFGDCEQCGVPIPAALLAAAPESRYCPDCAAGAPETGTRPAAGAPAHSGARAGRHR